MDIFLQQLNLAIVLPTFLQPPAAHLTFAELHALNFYQRQDYTVFLNRFSANSYSTLSKETTWEGRTHCILKFNNQASRTNHITQVRQPKPSANKNSGYVLYHEKQNSKLFLWPTNKTTQGQQNSDRSDGVIEESCTRRVASSSRLLDPWPRLGVLKKHDLESML